MEKDEAKEFICPLLKEKCICNECMFWFVDVETDIDECSILRMARGITPIGEGDKE